jgi:predicted dienelactone hydrolase
MSTRTRLWILVGLLASCGAANAAEESITIAGLSVRVWSNESPSGPQPVVVFSHGLHGCATQSRFLMDALASAGYLVFAPNHRDASCGKRGDLRRASTAAETPTGEDARPAPLGRPGAWTSSSYRDRADDIARLIDALRRDSRFSMRGDWTRIALAGHSLGGYTVLGLAGAWPEWKLRSINVKAVLALSPYAQPFQTHHTLSGLASPVMYQGGTRDIGITPWVQKGDGAYAQSPSPKYFVDFQEAGHFAWTNLQSTFHDSIVAYSVAFLNHYVKGDPADAALTHSRPDVVELRYESEIGTRK